MTIETKYNIGQEVYVMKSNHTSGQCPECGQLCDSIDLEDTKEKARIETIEIRDIKHITYGIRFSKYNGSMYLYNENRIISEVK